MSEEISAGEEAEAKVEPRVKKFADLREDFMKRWFAIAISFGFAKTVVDMQWVQDGIRPSADEWEQIYRLTAALVATVLSWEGYLSSIERKKLYDIWRYLLDIVLVFIYLFLLLTSRFSYFWLALHAITFGFYIFWDFITAWWYRKFGWFGPVDTPLWRVYWDGLTASNGVEPGPVITVIWGIYFVWVWALSGCAFPNSTFWFAVFVLAGLAGYRFNKGRFRGNLIYTFLVPLVTSGCLAVLIYRAQPV